MKFGQHLEYNIFPPWRNEYIQYNQLKYFLKDRQINHGGWTEDDEIYFTETLLIQELDKVNGFIYLKIKQVGLDPKKITDLINFININDIGFYKILKKHDKWTGISLLNSIRFRDLHHQFQSIVMRLNQNLNIDSTKEQVEEEAVEEKITTTKYWVHADHLTELQAILMFHLDPTSSSLINTVYFDDPTHFTLYSNLLERNQDAEIIRARWYGSTNNNADLYFERKFHHESWIENKGSYTKERFHLSTNKVDQYLSLGHYNNSTTSKSIFQSMQKNRLKSTLRSYHHRTTYNSASDNNKKQNDLHISLDNNLTFFKENQNLSSSWRRNDIGDEYPFSHLSQHDISFFPYAVLEVKTTQSKQIPDWFVELVEVNQLLYEVPYFSKFLHGVSLFYRDNLPLLPWWLGEMNIDIRRKSSYATIQSQTSSLGQCIVIEPPILPDYLHSYDNNNSNRREINNSNTASSFTIVDHQQQNNYQQEEEKDTKSPFEKFMHSSIVVKIKELNHEYNPKQERAENYVSMMRFLYAKITNDQKLLQSPQYPVPTTQQQQIMPKKGKLNKKKIEPKIFFANERTFISWLQFSALLLSVSLGLINFGDHISKASGGFFIVIAMILAVYSQLRFQYRAWQIRFRNDSRFDDTYGPAILAIVLVIALFVNLALRLNQPIPENPSPFGANNTRVNTGLSLDDDIKVINNNTNSSIIVNHHRYPNGTKIHHISSSKHKEEEEDEEDEA